MDIGIGLPNAVRGVQRSGIVDWARRAEQAGFSKICFPASADPAQVELLAEAAGL